MHHAPQPPHRRAMLARLTMLLTALLLGHFALMALDIHSEPVHAHNAHEISIEQCGTVDGVVKAPVHAPQLEPALMAMAWPFAMPVYNDPLPQAAAPPVDAATLRALLQIYLN